MSPSNLRITIFGLHYAPEHSGNAPYTTRLAEQLAADGHAVRVITGYPHYPEWKLKEGYSGWSSKEVINGVHVKRLRHFIPSRTGHIQRMHLELSFGLRAMLSPWGKTDFVLMVSPALFASALIAVRAKWGVQRPASGLWLQDIYSCGLEETSSASSLTVKAMRSVERAVCKLVTGVTVIHDRFKNYLVVSLGIPENFVTVVRNWTHLPSHGEFDRATFRRSLGWGEDEVVVLHAGNIGAKQAMENVVESARLAESRQSRVRFVLLGDGNQRKHIEQLATGIKNISFMSSLAESDYIMALRSADLLLVNERPGLREMSVPSKLTSYFASGVPVLAATESDSATAEELGRAGNGTIVPPADPGALLSAAELIVEDIELTERHSTAGIAYAHRVLSESSAIAEYKRWISHVYDVRGNKLSGSP